MNQQTGGRNRASIRSWVGAIVLAAGIATNGVEVVAFADQPLPLRMVGYQEGKITAVYQTNFLINGRAYRLTPDAMIYDDSGNQIDAGYIGVNLDVKFHVKKEQNDMIDMMVLYLPR